MPLPGLPQPPNAGLHIGQKILLDQLRKIAREKPDKLPQACLKVFEDAAGETQVQRAAVFQGAAQKYRIEIEPVDRHRAFALLRDSLDGKPDVAPSGENTQRVQVAFLHRAVGVDPARPDDIEALIQFELSEGTREPVDMDDPVPQANGHDEGEDDE